MSFGQWRSESAAECTEGNMKAGRAESRMGRLLGLGALGLGLALTGGCGLDDVTIPPIDGPATNALSVVVTADPDWLKADGVSTAVITAFARDTRGQPVSGRGFVLSILDAAGRVVKVGALNTDRIVTGSDGRARAVYTAPPSKEMASDFTVFVTARPDGNDSGGQFARAVEIDLIAVDERQYPPTPVPSSERITASFLTEPRHGPFFVGSPIHFQSTSGTISGAVITQYEWHWDDGTNNFSYGPEQYHTYTAEGTYFVFHSVIDNLGNFDSTNVQIDVEPAP